MRLSIKKIGILLFIFIAAVTLYFALSRREKEYTNTVYSASEKATLPIMYPEMFGRKMNPMHGYVQEMEQFAIRDSLTILPENRNLVLHVQDYGSSIESARFEVRSLDLERLLERTEIEMPNIKAEGVLNLPIQNLLTMGTEYLLKVELDTEQHGTVYYYTRILWTDEDITRSLVDLAVNFSSKTFDYDQARELVMYLETKASEDNSSLSSVTIRSNFSQLTWGKLEMRPIGDVQITLKESEGIMGTVLISYIAEQETEEGIRELYEVEESFTMKWNEIRTYLMDYSRKTNQIFTGDRSVFSGKRIMLGIVNEDKISTMASENGQFLAFVSNRDLWLYDQQDSKAVKVFSFRGTDELDVLSNYNQHDVKILSVSGQGDAIFLVYGYMNRGVNEGRIGLAGYRYSATGSSIEEIFFVPAKESFEQLKTDVEQLMYLTSQEMLYFLIDYTVYGVDLQSKEYMVVTGDLSDGSYAVSMDGSQFAWQENGNLNQASQIHWMDLETGKKPSIQGEEGEKVRALGFVGEDLVYGITREGDEWISNGRMQETPMFAIEIINHDLERENRYENTGSYISDVVVAESRIHLSRLIKTDVNEYLYAEDDTIVCNEPVDTDPLPGIGWYASPEKRKVYFVQLDNEIQNDLNIKISTPKRVNYETSEELVLGSRSAEQGMVFYAYGGGHFLGRSKNFSKALQSAFDEMGVVVDQNHRIVWSRINRSNARTIREPVRTASAMIRRLDNFINEYVYTDDMLLIDARGCTLNQMLYFIDKGYPLIAYDYDGRYLLVNGFDPFNITVTDPITGSTEKMGLSDGAEFFRLRGNDFICGLPIK